MAELASERTARRPRKTDRVVEASPAVVAIIDREGHVLAVLAGRGPARAFLRGGCA